MKEHILNYLRFLDTKWIRTIIAIIAIVPWSLIIILLLQIKHIVSQQPKIQHIPVIEVADTIINEQPKFYTQTPEEGLEEALEYYGIHHKDIVFAQAVLETGKFKSKICKENNNLFGLYNSKNKEYYKFNHWKESVIAYKKIQNKYESSDNYYTFLRKINYAEDPEYINKIKEIVKQYDKRGNK